MIQLIFVVQNKNGFGVGLTLNEAQTKLENLTDRKGDFLTVFLFEGKVDQTYEAMNSIQVHHNSMLWDMTTMTFVHEESL